jgi:hypothetical protein
MQDHVSRIVGLEGFGVKRVIEVGDRLDLEVELVARAALPLAGRSAAGVRSGIGSCYAAWARSAAPIGWRLTRTAVQAAWNADFRAPR